MRALAWFANYCSCIIYTALITNVRSLQSAIVAVFPSFLFLVISQNIPAIFKTTNSLMHMNTNTT